MMHENAKVLVLGANGQLGTEIKKLSLQYTDFIFVFADRSMIDITEPKSVEQIIYHNPDFIINCAAYTAVDKAENNAEQADLINHKACQYIVEGAMKTDAIVIHISTDYVYHNDSCAPLLETDECRPQGIYAISKYYGENIIKQYPKHVILRTSWVYGNEGINFFKTMVNLSHKDELSIVADQYGAPTYAVDLAATCLAIVKHFDSVDKDVNSFGTYNFSNEGCITWFDFASAIFEKREVPIKLNKTTTEAYNAPAPRPYWSVLSKQKIKRTFGIQTDHWLEALQRCMNEADFPSKNSNINFTN